MKKKFATIYSDLSIASIEMVKSVLEGHDILCNVKGFDQTRNLPLPIIELQVPEKDKRRAKRILQAHDIGQKGTGRRAVK